MTDLFLRVVELSWQAGVLALAVMLARLALRRAPKWAVCMLWALVAVRLIVPVSLQSRVSLQAEQSPVTAALEQLPQTQETADAILPSGGEVLTPVQPVGCHVRRAGAGGPPRYDGGGADGGMAGGRGIHAGVYAGQLSAALPAGADGGARGG